MSDRIGRQVDLRRIAARVAAGAPSWARWFHVSPWDLGRTTVLVPRVPEGLKKARSGEDCTTPRVCLAPTVKAALGARTGEADRAYADSEDGFYVYATGDIAITMPERTPDLEPGDVWDWDAWATEHGVDPGSQKDYEQAVEGYLPDTETGEGWSTAPVRMTKVGMVRGSDGSRVMWNVPKGVDEDDDTREERPKNVLRAIPSR